MRGKKIIRKIVILTVVFFLIGGFLNIIDPIAKNTLAMNQMDIDTFSNTWVVLYQKMVGFYPFFVVVMSLLVFKNDILWFTKKLLSRKGEK